MKVENISVKLRMEWKCILYSMSRKATNKINIFSTSRVKEKSYSTKWFESLEFSFYYSTILAKGYISLLQATSFLALSLGREHESILK